MRKYKYPIKMKMFVQNDVSFHIEKRSTLQKGVNNIWKIISFKCFPEIFFQLSCWKFISERCPKPWMSINGSGVVYPNFLLCEIKSDYTLLKRENVYKVEGHEQTTLGQFLEFLLWNVTWPFFLSSMNIYSKQKKAWWPPA